MKLRLFLLVVVLAPAQYCLGKVTQLSSVDRQKIENPATITLLRSLRGLPAPVAKACAAGSTDRHFRLAEPSQHFQVTDAMSGAGGNLPRRRLIWAAAIPGYYVIHYESGGRAHSYHILVVAFDAPRKTARVVWAAAAVPLKDYGDFLRALKTQKLDDTLDYYR